MPEDGADRNVIRHERLSALEVRLRLADELVLAREGDGEREGRKEPTGELTDADERQARVLALGQGDRLFQRLRSCARAVNSHEDAPEHDLSPCFRNALRD